MMTVWLSFSKGGLVMYPLLACSFLVVVIFVERILFYKERNISEKCFADIKYNLQNKNFDEALVAAKDSASDVAEIISYYLESGANKNDKVQTLETRVNIMLNAYEEKLSLLSSIITLAPLLGLLGTISGIMSSFKIFTIASSQPFAITEGIGEALTATAFGLLVAILALLLYSILKYYISILNKILQYTCLLLIANDR